MDLTRRPFEVPPDFATYAERHNIYDTLEGLMKTLLIEQPQDVFATMKEFLQRKAVLNVILFGPPGSGKSTLATKIVEKLGVVNVDAAQVVRSNIAEGTELGVKAKSFTAKGDVVPDDVVTECVLDQLKSAECRDKGWVLHGFPNTRDQALALQMAGFLCTHLINLTLTDDVCALRCKGKRVDRSTGQVYHTDFAPPPLGIDVQEDPECAEDRVSDRLRRFRRHEFATCNSFAKYKRTIDAHRPVEDVFDAVWHQLCIRPKSNAPMIPRVAILGPTGAGKTVQASTLASIYSAVHVNADILVKTAISSGSKIGQTLKSYTDKNMQIPDSMLVKLVIEKLWDKECVTRGWVLDGFPHTRAQAEALAKEGFTPSRVVFLDLPGTSALERLSLRRIDPVTGQRYHLSRRPPPNAKVEERLLQHPSDEESEIQRRLMNYAAFESELKSYFTQHTVIDAENNHENVFELIEGYLVRPALSHPTQEP
eukprot:m.28626 g.28626  ORF g.28626 m.28626 type:complete len:481 (-) comp9057_c0_seq1:111-1553(-)